MNKVDPPPPVWGTWHPIETIPKEGEFLVYLPEEHRPFQIGYYHSKIVVIGNTFAFDLTKPSHYMVLPPRPENLPPSPKD